ncbi:MAG TPA: ABC transporter permease, partial [Vicinamibacterales bacterium]|nr:ABC transporter permease [Vicinamibacterales bacterium]
MLQDLKYTLRSLRHQPAFALIAILTLAVGIGATTAIFTTVNAVLLRQLPFREPANLYALRTELTDGRITTGTVSPRELAELNKMTNLVESATGALRYEGSIVDREGNPIRVVLQGVAPKFFPTFGVPVAAGRDFTPEELGPDGPFAVIISHRAWKTYFAGDPKILGQSVTMEGGPVTVVGVAGEGFNFPGGADGWFTIKIPETNTGHSFDGFVRTRPGVTIDQLRAGIHPLALTLQKEFPAANGSRVFTVLPLQDAVVGPLGPTLMVVLSASALLLLVACVNVTSLLLSRGVVRAREVAVRVALGAGRWRILRQLFTESLVLGLAGAIGGVIVAYGGLRLLMSAGAGQLPRLNDLRLDAATMLFSLAASVVTAVLVGFAPALRLARTDVKTLVNETGRGGAAGPATHRLLQGLVIAEIALAVVLTIGAALLVRSFANLQRTDPGFNPQGRIVFEVSLPVL